MWVERWVGELARVRVECLVDDTARAVEAALRVEGFCFAGFIADTGDGGRRLSAPAAWLSVVKRWVQRTKEN